MTSYLFPNAQFSLDRLKVVLNALGHDKNKLVIDLSCRKQGDKWIVTMNKWQALTDMELNQGQSPHHLYIKMWLNSIPSIDQIA